MSSKLILTTLMIFTLLFVGCNEGKSSDVNGGVESTTDVREAEDLKEPAYLTVLRESGYSIDSVDSKLLSRAGRELLDKEMYKESIVLLAEGVQRDDSPVEAFFNYAVVGSLLLDSGSSEGLELDALFIALRRAVELDKNYLKRVKDDVRLDALKRDPIYFRFVELYREFSVEKDEFDMIVNPFFTADFRASDEVSRQITYVSSLRDAANLENKESFLYGTWYDEFMSDRITILAPEGKCYSIHFQTHDNEDLTEYGEGEWSFVPESSQIVFKWPNIDEPVELTIEEVNYYSLKYAGYESSSLRRSTPLAYAAFYDDYNKLKLIFESGIVPASYIEELFVFDYIFQRGRLKTVLLILENGVKVDNSFFLSTAIYYDRLDVVQLLVENGADITYIDDEYGRNYLHRYLSRYNDKVDLEVVKYLLKMGVDPSLEDYEGVNVYQLAEKREDKATYEYLMEQQSDERR